MKMKRFGALATAVVLALSLLPVSAGAIEFTDVPKDFWGYEEINKMSNKGYAKGYEDGTFKPNGKMTAAETLLFCARATGVDTDTQALIAKDRAEEMKETLPEANKMNEWAAKEMAVAVEAGVLSIAELEQLAQTDPKSEKRDKDDNVISSRTYLEQTMPRENICMYLVRAMQLEPLARSLSSYPLNYKDADDIAASLRPYVFVLTNFGIVKGKSAGYFDPKGAVTRAEMTTMLSRALAFMDEVGIVTELSEYTSYAWQAGTISNVTSAADGTTIVTLTSDITGVQSYTLPSGVKIYKDNMIISATALKNGEYARLNLNANGGVKEVRLSGALTSYMGTVSDLTGSKLSLLVGGEARNFTIDRFTQVMAGKTVGDRTIIDEDAGYTSAVCYVDSLGHLAGVKFSGGTQAARGLVESVTTNASTGETVLGVTGYNGVVYRYTVPAGIAVTVNGALASLSSGHVGKHVELRVNEDGKTAVSAAVDTVSKFVQGPITRRDISGGGSVPGVTISDRISGKEVTHIINLSAAITFDGKIKTISDIETGWYVTALVSNNAITAIYAFPGSTVVEGVLSNISYGAPTVLQITKKDDTVVRYDLDMALLPEITRSGKKSTIDKLATGDQLVLTMRYNKVERIEATPQTADLTGTITKVTQETGKVEVEIKLSDGTDVTYSVPEGMTVTQNGAAAKIYDLQPTQGVALVTSGDELLSIEIVTAAASSTSLTGKVYIPATSSNKVMTILVQDTSGEYKQTVQVNVKGANLGSIASTESLNVNKFAVGDMVIVYGAYDGATFNATYVLKQ